MKKTIFTSFFFIMGIFSMSAQEREVDYLTDTVVTPQFFIAVIAGVLLAMGFQFILTALSVALGITAIGDIKEKYAHSKTGYNNDDDSDGMSTGSMITTGFGLWSVITVGISLFGATALAINLSLISNTVIAITLGLVIWATFFILLFYLESKMVNTLVGGLINTATAGLRTSGEAVKNLFSTSQEQQMKNVAEDTVDKIKKEFSASIDARAINDTIDHFFEKVDHEIDRVDNKVDKKVPSYQEVKNDIEAIVKEAVESSNEAQKTAAKQSGGQSSPGKWMAIQQIMSNAISESSKGGDRDQSKVQQLKTLQKELKEAYDQGGTKEEKMEKVAAKLTSAEEDEIHGYVEKIKSALASTTPDEVEKGQLQDKLMGIVKNPKVEGVKLLHKLEEIDRATIISLISKNTNIPRQQAETYADKIEEFIQMIKVQLSKGEGVSREVKQKLESTIGGFLGQSSGNGSSSGSGVNFSQLTHFFQDKLDFSGSQNNMEGIKRKLQNMDTETVKGTVVNNSFVKEKDIDKVVSSFEEAKSNVLQKIDEIEQEATRRLKTLERKAVIQAERTRKNAAAAAWWLVISALLSAGAAIGGSLIAMG